MLQQFIRESNRSSAVSAREETIQLWFHLLKSGDLKRHVTTVYGRQKPFNCSICDAIFNQSGSLKAQVARV
jgi:hypothetical protein